MSRIFLLAVVVFFCFGQAKGLNLVPNNGFESYTQFPTNYGQLDACVGWSNVNGVYTFTWPWASPDYLHANGCCGVQLPSTAFGTVHAYAGDAVAHIIPYYSPFADDYREYITTQLSQPMIAGVTYEVSFYAQNGENHDYIQGCDHLGVCFSSGSLSQVDHEPIAVTPQLEYPGIFYDTAWHLISFTFTPSSDYDWITIGNFYDDASTSTQTFWPTGLLGVQLFIDEVVVEPITIPLTASGDTTICKGNPVTLTASGNGGYWWENLVDPGVSIDNDSLLNVTPIVTSTFVVHDSFSSDTIEVTVMNPPTVDLGNDTTICSGQSVLLDAQNTGATFQWSTGSASQLITATTSGSFWVNVDNGICTSSDTIIISVLSSPSVDLGPDQTGCIGQSFVLVAGNAAIYLWSTGSTDSSITVNVTGSYWVLSGNGLCTASDTISILILPPPVADLGPDTTLCEGQTIILNGGTASSYLWSTGSTNATISAVASGSYYVSLSNGSCSDGDTINVTFLPLPFVNLGPDVTLCKGQSLTLNGGSAATYLWSTGSIDSIIEVSAAGNYSLAISDGSCLNSDTMQFSTIDSPDIDLGSDVEICEGESVSFFANANGVSYLWSTGETSSSILVSTAGIFSVTVNNGYCTGSDSIQVTLYPLPQLNLGHDTAICAGQTLVLDAGNAGTTIKWSTGETSQQIVVTQSPVEISVVVTNHGCKASDTINVDNNCGVIVPNAFTPNGDGLNDLFMAITNGVNDFELRIFNRFGEMIFMTTDPDTGWDGRYMGKEEEIGTYVYVIKSQTLTGDPEIYKGNVTLLR